MSKSAPELSRVQREAMAKAKLDRAMGIGTKPVTRKTKPVAAPKKVSKPQGQRKYTGNFSNVRRKNIDDASGFGTK